MYVAGSCLTNINITMNRNDSGCSLAGASVCRSVCVSVQKVLQKPFRRQATGTHGEWAARTPGFHFPPMTDLPGPAGKIMPLIPLARGAPLISGAWCLSCPSAPKTIGIATGRREREEIFHSSSNTMMGMVWHRTAKAILSFWQQRKKKKQIF